MYVARSWRPRSSRIRPSARRLARTAAQAGVGVGPPTISLPMDATKAAAETRPARSERSEGSATADSSFGQAQRVLVDLSAFDGYDGTALGTVRGSDNYGRVVSAW